MLTECLWDCALPRLGTRPGPPTPVSPQVPTKPARSQRKATPRRAPSQDSTKLTPSINVSLLLRAMLREGERSGLDNKRHPDQPKPAPADPAKLKPRQRDLLPPPMPGFGRGRRSASATVGGARSSDEGSSAGPGPSRLRAGGSASRTSSPARKAAANLKVQNRATASKRALSIEPAGLDNLVGSRNLARASSVGAGPSPLGAGQHQHNHAHHLELPQPSPLARSISYQSSPKQAAGPKTPSSLGRDSTPGVSASGRKVVPRNLQVSFDTLAVARPRLRPRLGQSRAWARSPAVWDHSLRARRSAALPGPPKLTRSTRWLLQDYELVLTF